MPLVFIIAPDWQLRSMVRAELRERGIDALALATAAEAGVRIASGMLPSVVVLEASGEVAPGLESLARRVPFAVITSAVTSEVWPAAAERVLRRPVRVAEIVDAVLALLKGHPA